MSDSSRKTQFYQLEPQNVLEAVEEAGFRPTGEFQQLNSYENRVFDVFLEDGERVIAKFYRPGRWSREALQDEHHFLHDLKAEGIPAVAPLTLPNGEYVLDQDGIFVTVFPRVLGRMPQEFLAGELKQVGRRLAHLHNVGSRTEAVHRPFMTVEDYGWPALETVLPWVDAGLVDRYENAGESILEFLEDELDPESFIRIHGDCHKGNLLHNGDEFFFVDFDDFLNGPVAQDFWMLFSGENLESEKEEILSGYEELRIYPEFAPEIFEALRGLRILHYAAWIIRRWNDPSFPRIFPDFNSHRYWAEETEALERIFWKIK